ncbi:MAG TPA: response regulator [Methylophilus sp.]|uniref:response regulator n=1 Tax=Methylophilus sp. TaxID=29541 RepID=UPI002BC9E611|nr:response regulator [Methylophilus sp.]HSH88069.1 response regulator [Methylophilus sp.]
MLSGVVPGNSKRKELWALESIIIYGFISFFTLLVILGITSIIYLQRFSETNRWITHTNQVISKLDRGLGLFNQLEVSQRGFLLTGDTSAINRRDLALAELQKDITELSVLTKDNSFQQKQITLLRRLIDSRLVYFNQIVNMARTTSAEQLNAFLRKDSIRREDMLEIRGVFSAMSLEEQNLLADRTELEQDHTKDLLTLFVVMSVAILIFFPMLIWRIQRDLKIRKQASLEQKRLTDILDASPDLIANANLQGDYFYLNRGGRKLLGIGEDEDITSQPISRMRPAWAIDIIHNKAIPSAITTGMWSGETAFINRGGITIPVSQVVVVHKDANGVASHLSTVARNVSDFKKIAHDLKHAAVYDQTHSEVLRLFNANYDRSHILPGMLDILARNHPFPVSAIYTYDEWSGIYKLESTHAVPTNILTEFKLGHGVIGEAIQNNQTLVLSDVEEFPSLTIETGLLSIQPAGIMICPVIYQEKPLAVLVLAASQTITERDQTFIERLSAQLGVALHNIQQYGDLKLLADQLHLRSEEIGLKNAQLLEADKMKSEFLATMSHELRTPLNAIIGFSEILKDGLIGPLEDKQRVYVTDIFESGQHLLSLINDVLDLSKIEAGRMELEGEVIDIQGLLQNSLSIIKEKASAQRIKLQADLSESLDRAWLDARKVKQIVYNLLSNAVKFTPEGGQVTLQASLVTREEVLKQTKNILQNHYAGIGNAEQFIQIAVTDTGIGIEADDIARLFQPFVQVESTLSRRFEGTGLGLALVRKLAELHSGAVAVKSTPGKGSTFTVWLQYKSNLIDAALATTSSGESIRQLVQNENPHVLVLEDDDRAADLIRLQLESDKCRVTRAATAEIALAILADGIPPDLITLDILLPGMDGWEFLTKLKTNPKLAHIPVVIISIVADSNKGLSLGAAQVLQKPVSADDLQNALAKLGFTKPSNNQPGAKVLVVDDDPKAVEIISSYLEHTKHTVLRAYGGNEATNIAKLQQPDLIVLDLMMPEINGFEVVEELRKDSRTAKIPIIIVTSKFLTPPEQQVLKGHVLAVLEKSEFNHGNFLSEVHRALAGKVKRTSEPKA